MTGIVDWAASRARMVIAFIALSLLAGGFAYVGLPKEGEPDIEIPALFVSVPFPGISAEDSESLLVKPMETELADLDGLKTMSSTASEGYAGVALEFEFGWDKSKTLADVRDAMTRAEAQFPDGADQYSINEINFSEFPIVIVNLTGDVPERTLLRYAKELQDAIESLDAVLEAGIAGERDEMLEVIIDPLKLEAYNVTAGELINVVVNNNLLVAAGEIETEAGAFGVKIPSSFDDARDVYDLPVKVNGDRVVTLGDLAEISLTFEDRRGTARFNGTQTVALQVVKAKGYNLIDTVELVEQTIADEVATWPPELQAAIEVGTSNDQSVNVESMVRQLEGSVLTAVALVMIVVLAALGTRPALLVGFAVPTSFFLCFLLLGLTGVSISNIVMFGLILAVGMLVDGAIVVVEYADKRIQEGSGPMHAYVEAAKRMFWPIVSSTATTLCAFLPMLFWPGVPGEFMGMLPVTLIYVLSASLIVALISLPVMGGVSGRLSRAYSRASDALRVAIPWWIVRALLVLPAIMLTFIGAMWLLNPAYLTGEPILGGGTMATLAAGVVFLAGASAVSITMGAAAIRREPKAINAGYRRTPFGRFIHLLTGNPIMPFVAIGAVLFVVMTTFSIYGQNNNGVEFFVETEPEQGTVYVRARGNLSLAEKDALVREAEEVVLAHPGVKNAFSFAGDGGLNTDASGASVPRDTIGQVQFEVLPWEERAGDPSLDGNVILDEIQAELDELPGIKAEILALAQGPASGKPVHLRIKGDDFGGLQEITATVRERFEATPGLVLVEDTLPLPGIDWQIDVDVEKAGRFGADVATVGAMVQLVTRGILLDTYTPDGSDEEIEIRVRLPEEDRVLSTLDSLRVRTNAGLVPLSNFITRTPVAKLAQIDRVDQQRYFDVKADVIAGLQKVVPADADLTQRFPDEDVLGWVTEVTAESPAVPNGGPTFTLSDGTTWQLRERGTLGLDALADAMEEGSRLVPVTPNDRIAALNAWLDEGAIPPQFATEWTGDQEEQAESGQFLMTAFAGALGLMFIILLAQFNSFYNAVLVLLAVVLSTTGVLIGMLVMDQPFSIIMTGTGIVALAGIVVNNNIVLIDTYQEYSQYMPRIEAITRTAEDRIRPVLLTTITTMAGLTPMMFGLSLDFINGGYTINSPTALWWKQLATAVVFGLGVATVLTLIFTPSLLALRVWFWTYVEWFAKLLAMMSFGRQSKLARDWALERKARRIRMPEVIWVDEDELPRVGDDPPLTLRPAAE